jgi:hypothetical protein
MIIKIPFRGKIHFLNLERWSIPKREVRTIGFHSRCQDGLHIVMLDYDHIDKVIFLQDLRWLQEVFGLSEFYMFKTRKETEIDVYGNKQIVGCYHAVSFDKLSFSELNLVIGRSHCDASFKRGPRINPARVWTLRSHRKGYGMKPEYIGTLPSQSTNYEQSSAHAEYVKRHYRVDITLRNPDNLDYMWLEGYNTKVME